MSTAVAFFGLLLPIAFSLPLLHFAFEFTLLQSFSAGAALSTTSLGTTFSVISQAGIAPTRLGAVLSSAAVADDVVGLILLQVITSLGGTLNGSDANLGWAVGKPLLTSAAMLLVSWILLKLVIRPSFVWLLSNMPAQVNEQRFHLFNLVISLLVASAYTAVASLSGSKSIYALDGRKLTKHTTASILLGAFVAGLVLAALIVISRKMLPDAPTIDNTYKVYIAQVQAYILRPFFFASIGYAIPIRLMFNGSVVWKGIVYSLLMAVAKLATGAFVVLEYTYKKLNKPSATAIASAAVPSVAIASDRGSERSGSETSHTFPPREPSKRSTTRQPSLLPASLLLGSAMVARGEISLLIANLALASSPSLMPDDLFYLILWATLLCTVAGPVTVGTVVKQMQKSNQMLPPEWDAPKHSSSTQGRRANQYQVSNTSGST
ncbi:hypothetical protein EMMF5_001337 [Cystobasidiomycetes sp. EMM_F5]